MSQSTLIAETNEIRKALNRVGLNISDAEINQILQEKQISLTSRDLSEIGSLFILASAISAINCGKSKKTLTFEDLPEKIGDSISCMGIPLYFWHSDLFGRCGLYLTLVNGKPGIATCYENTERTLQNSSQG
jgi:hypothetical protein